jgi:hypothetical protein
MKKVTVNINELEHNEIVHQELDEKLVNRIKKFRSKLKEVSDVDLDVTIENFRKDPNPEEEVIVWEVITHSYEEAVKEIGDQSIEVKYEIYNLVLLRSLMPAKDVLEQIKLKKIDHATAVKVLSFYKEEHEPIKVSTK